MLSHAYQINLNQLGYSPGLTKVFTSNAAGRFEVVNGRSGETVYSGETSPLRPDESSGIPVAQGDFSAVGSPGSYFIRLTDAGVQSPLFPIGGRPYQTIKNALLKSFYYQRCGVELEAAYAGPWSHKACHLSDAYVHGKPEERYSQTGGWHDAGDYGKYTVAASKAVADLMLAYEWFPSAFREPVGIPDPEIRMPDVLAEVRFELLFLLKMQRRDGAVYHKVTTAEFPALDCMPESDTADLIFSPISDTSTAAFAAVMAMAARIYRDMDASMAENYGRAAKSAWKWLTENHSGAGFKNPSDIKTGEYGDDCRLDEKYWAAAELYRWTREPQYLAAAQELAGSEAFSLCELGWADTGGYGTLCLLSMEAGDLPAPLRSQLLNAWAAEADSCVGRCAADGFGVALLPDEYIWGSNMLVMNRAMLLITASRLTGRTSFASAALDQWHYLLGRNTLGYCYVTGFGAKPVMNPHHRPSVGDGIPEPVPGMVAGGPNSSIQDEAAASLLKGQPPAACFIDHKDSYSTNEMTIYWNSPAVFVAAFADLNGD